MPSQPDPNSPFLAGRAQADLGARIPGMPSITGSPSVQTGGFNIPAPPSPASAPNGRPPAGGVPQATTPQASVPGATATAGATPADNPNAAAAAGPTFDPMAAQARDQMAREIILRKRKDLGEVPAVFKNPSLPEMPVELGGWNINPFTGRWSK